MSEELLRAERAIALRKAIRGAALVWEQEGNLLAANAYERIALLNDDELMRVKVLMTDANAFDAPDNSEYRVRAKSFKGAPSWVYMRLEEDGGAIFVSGYRSATKMNYAQASKAREAAIMFGWHDCELEVIKLADPVEARTNDTVASRHI